MKKFIAETPKQNEFKREYRNCLAPSSSGSEQKKFFTKRKELIESLEGGDSKLAQKISFVFFYEKYAEPEILSVLLSKILLILLSNKKLILPGLLWFELEFVEKHFHEFRFSSNEEIKTALTNIRELRGK
ncbi:MAG: hypothetical protein WC178_05115 [Candidatus Paceibacterota bacterium]